MNKKWVVIVVSILVGFIIFCGILFVSSEKNKNDAYEQAVECLAKGQYETAYDMFDELRGYKNADTLLQEVVYQNGISKMNDEEFEAALDLLLTIPEYKASAAKIEEIRKHLQSDGTINMSGENQNITKKSGDTENGKSSDNEKDSKTSASANEDTEIRLGDYKRTVDRDGDSYYLMRVSIEEGNNIGISYTLYHKDCDFEGGRITGYTLLYDEIAKWDDEKKEYLLEKGSSKYTISVLNANEISLELQSENEHEQQFVGKYLRED